MKKLFVIAFITALITVDAQVVRTSPFFAKETDSIVVTFNAAEGNKGLMDYSGNVYTHTKIVTNFSTPSNL